MSFKPRQLSREPGNLFAAWQTITKNFLVMLWVWQKRGTRIEVKKYVYKNKMRPSICSRSLASGTAHFTLKK